MCFSHLVEIPIVSICLSMVTQIQMTLLLYLFSDGRIYAIYDLHHFLFESPT